MDTLDEESSANGSECSISSSPSISENDQARTIGCIVTNVEQQILSRPAQDLELVVRNDDIASRRPSAIIAALRRPSQAVALNAAQAIMNQRRYMLGFMQGSDKSICSKDHEDKQKPASNGQLKNAAITIGMSALYAKLIVVLGVALPVTEIISTCAPVAFYQGFYLYLYISSIIFVGYMYLTILREKTDRAMSLHQTKNDKANVTFEATKRTAPRYGSFYLRLGAIAFGIGSMVHSGLEIGQYLERKNDDRCSIDLFRALIPFTRMVLTMVQIQFLFLNTKDMKMNKRFIIAKFGLMHMIASNLCQWLYVLVEETKHEILHLGHETNTTNVTHTNDTLLQLHQREIQYDCRRNSIMGQLVQNVSPFLFPCTIEYSLICAVILFEMWKKVKSNPDGDYGAPSHNKDLTRPSIQVLHEKLQHFTFGAFGGAPLKSEHHFSVDCANAHRGLFGGILLIVLTIISLIMFFVLTKVNEMKEVALFEVNIVEICLYALTTTAVIVAMLQMRKMKYDKRAHERHSGLSLDNTLLVVAQTGMYIYCLFSMIGCYFQNVPEGLIAELFSLIQTTCQTLFVLDAGWRRCRNIDQVARKPGRELVTFLIVANIAMWSINALEKNRAEYRQTHADFFGYWAWTIITHVSMPLAIFYRFHSTICLFEIWKSAYKMKTPYQNLLSTPL